jgi:hypothetical protein
MRVEYSHALSREIAYERINSLLAELQTKYSDKIRYLSSSWNPERTKMNYRLETSVFDTEGNISLENNKVILEGKVPLTARMLTGKIKDIIRKKLDDLFKK